MRRTIMLAALIVGAALIAPAAGSAAGPGFGPAEKAVGGQFYWGMDLAVDAGGHLHVVGAGLKGDRSGVWYATDRSGTWVRRRIITWSLGNVFIHPSIALDGNGRVHIALDKVRCVECSVTSAKGIFTVSDVGRPRGTFGDPVRLMPRGTAQPSLRISGGHRFLAFAGNPDLPPAAVRLKTDASGAWTTTQVAAAGTDPFLRLAMNGRPRVLFEVASGIKYARASSLTGGWTVERVDGTVAADAHPVLSIDEDGGVHAAWEHAPCCAPGHVRYSQRIGGEWLDPAADVATGTDPALGVDRPLHPWVAVVEDDGLWAYYPSGPGHWFTAIQVSPVPAADPRIKVLDSGQVVVAWLGGDPLAIWVSRST